MAGILLFIYGLFFIGTGIQGNAPQLLTEIESEKQFLYWIVILLVIGALWETESGEKIARPFVVLIVLGFLLKNNNWQTIATNAKNLMSATSSTAVPSFQTPSTGAS